MLDRILWRMRNLIGRRWFGLFPHWEVKPAGGDRCQGDTAGNTASGRWNFPGMSGEVQGLDLDAELG